MGKQRQHTKAELEEMEAMKAFLQETKNDLPDNANKSNTDFVGNVVSTRDVIQEDNSLAEFNKREADIQKGYDHVMGVANAYKRIAEDEKKAKEVEKEAANPDYKSPLLEQIKRKNREIEVDNMSELEKMYYTELEPDVYHKKRDLQEKVQALKDSEDGYEIIEYQVKTMDGGYDYRTKKVRTSDHRAEIQKLEKEINEISKPINKMFSDIAKAKRQEVKDLQSSDDTSYFSHLYEEAHLAEVFYEKAIDIADANVNDSGFWKAMADGVTDEDFYTLGSASLDANIRLAAIANKIDAEEELDQGEILLLDAYSTYSEAQSQIDTGGMYSVGSSTAGSIPWMIQFAATRGVGVAAEKSIELAIKKGVKKYLGKNIKKKVSSKLLNTAIKGVAVTGGVYTQASLMPQTYSDIADRYHGQLQVTRNAEGKIDNYYMRDKLHEKVTRERKAQIENIKNNPESYDGEDLKVEAKKKIQDAQDIIDNSKPASLLESAYKGYTNSAIEALTERVGGEFITNKFKKLGINLNLFPKGKYSPEFGRFKQAIGWNGIAPEYLEEVMNTPLNAFFVGDSQYSDLWDGQQQLHTLMQVAITGGGMSLGHQGLNLPSRLRNKEYYKERKEMINKFNELKNANPSEIDKLINLSSSSSDIISMREMEKELREEGKDKEANILGEKILYNQMLKAFDTGSIDQFEEALSSISVNPDAPEGVRQNAIKAKVDIASLKRTDKKFRGLKNHGTIMRLQTNKIMARKSVQEIDSQLLELEQDFKDDIEAYAQQKGIEVPSYSPSTLFTQEIEDKIENDKHQKFLGKIRSSGLSSVAQFENLQTAKQTIEQIGKEQRLLFNEQISPEFQKKMEDEFKLKSILNKDKKFNKAVQENDDVAYEKAFERIIGLNKGSLSQKRISEIKEELDQFIGQRKFNQEIDKQEVINQAIETIKQEETYNVEPTTDSQIQEQTEKTFEDEETNDINSALDENFSSQVASIKDVFKTGEEGATVIPDVDTSDFFTDLPKQLSSNLSQEQSNKIQGKVKSMFDILKNQTNETPKFNDLVNKFIESSTMEQAEEYYNVLALGWKLNGYSKTDFKKQYDKIFDPFKEVANEMLSDSSMFGPETQVELEIENDKIIVKAEKKSSPTVGFTEQNVPIKKTEGMKTVTSELKLGFLSLRYSEVTNKDGVVERKTLGSNLNSDGIIDFRDLLNPDKFNKGSQLYVSVPSEEILGKIYITNRNEQGEKNSVLFNTWLQGKLKDNPDFKKTEEYISRVPVLAYSQEGKPLAYIHDVNWYNPFNIGFSDNLPKQAEIIEKGKKEVLDLRKQIISNGLKTVKIKSKTGQVFHKIDTSQPTISISQANPQSQIAVAKNRGQLYQGEEAFENSNRILLNKDDITKGHAYDIRRIGIDKDGKQTWMAFEVLRGDETNNYKLDTPTYQTIKWALASFLKTNNFSSYFKKKEFQITEEKAKEVVGEIFSETGYDISQRDDLYRFMKQYILFQDLDYKTLSDKLFNDDVEIGKDFQQHTSNSAIGTNPKMITVSEDGTVTPMNKKYQDYLKDVLRTNIQSFNIGTEEAPVYATAIQPNIKYGYDEEVTTKTTVREQVEIAVEEVKKELAENKEPDALIDKANSLLNSLGFNPDVNFDLPTQIENTSIIEKIFNTTDGLSVIQEYQLIDFIFNKISNSIGINKEDSVNKDLLLDEIKNSYSQIIEPSRKEVEVILKQITDLYNSNPDKYAKMGKLIQEYNKVIDVYNNIKNNWSGIEEKSLNKLYKYTGIKEGQESENNNESLREKSYSKSSLEENGKDKTSYRLRRFFAGVEQKTPTGDIKKGFLNLPTYVGFNDVYNSVAQILSSPIEIESNFDLMIEKLEQAKETHKWLPEVIERLKEADTQIQKEFVYNYTKHTLSMKFAMYSTDGNGNYSLKVYDTNANEITRLIRSTWRNNFITTPLVNSNGEFYSINKVQAQTLLNQFEQWGTDAPNINKDVMRNWLTNFGIVMSKDAFNELAEKGIYYNGENIEYKDMFDSNDTVFGLLHRYLKHIVNVDNTEFEENENNHPYTDMAGVLQALSTLESKYTNQSMTLSFRDNGKSIFGLTPNKFITDRVLALKQYDNGKNEFVEDLLSISMSSDSTILNLLELEEDFRSKLSIDHIGITSLKQHGKKASPFSNITDLNSIDHDVAKMTGFQDTKQGNVNATINAEGNLQKGGNGISMRMGRMFLPTMSDKSQMLMINTGVFNLLKDKRKAFEIDSEGKIDFTDSLNNLLFNQLVKPELKRIIKFHSDINNTNIKDYDLAAQIFNFIPELNNIKDDNGIRMIELIANDPKTFNIDKVQELFGNKINKGLKDLIDKKVNEKLTVWESAVERDEKDNIKAVKFFDSTYLSQASGNLEEKYQIGMYDFIINSFISNANMFTTMAGDPAIYSQDKLFKNFGVDNIGIKQMAAIYGKEEVFKLYNNHSSFLKDLDKLLTDGKITEKLYGEMKSKIKPLPFSGQDSDYNSLSEKIGVNIGKRLALLIAPGNKIADSKNEKYMQIFLEDAIHMSENIEYLIDLYYGKDALANVKDSIDRYKDSNIESQRTEIRNFLSKKFPNLSEYFDIESTDAQEYTTVDEHLMVLEGQGRLTANQTKMISEKLMSGEDLTKVDLDLVLQPIKPVHTGQIVDKEQDVLRTVYIKSSSFPLIPQLTKGRKIDALRLKLEDLQTKNQMPVRASYQTANKVGAVKNAINAFDEASLENAEQSSLILDRDNFRIQQDVPFKSDMKKEDKVSMGTQIFKLLFGDGMLDQSGFQINGETMSGRDLYDKFNKDFAQLISLKKKGLYNELGLNDQGLPVDQKKSIEKLQDLLQREAIDRGYPRQDVEGLTFVEKKDINGNVYYDFKLPLWISSNSNRYEALLNAIVTNRLIAQKIPGSSYVVGSEEGFEVKEDMSGIDESKIIHIGNYKGGELKGVQRQDGTFTSAEVLVPSKFKNSQGQLIDLYEKKNGKYIYLKLGENKELILDEEMFDMELLTSFSFRTPTSSHVSGSVIKIAGIIPPISGDLMIVPKNFTKQKGLDYDVDKETAYQLWHLFNRQSGKIEVLNQEHKEEALSKLKNRLESSKTDDVYDRMMRAIFPSTYDDILVDEVSSIENKIEKISNKFEQKLLENEFIKVHISVFSNPNKEVQKKINKVLSMDFAKSQAEFISELGKLNLDTTAFTILSDEYQKQKMALGAAGKLAIGVYSNYVTFHGLSQQSRNPLQLKEDGEDGLINKGFTIGNFTSSGVIGQLNTLDGDRSIAEVFAERQNTATDNEKEQILGRVNVNGNTINVDSLLTLLGFDKGEIVDGEETSISYLFLSQPIIKDYVELMQASQAITADYNFNREEEIFKTLINRYSDKFQKDDSSEILNEEQFEDLSKKLTSENMVNAIKTKGDNIPGLQMAVLQQFLELDTYAKAMGSVQSVLNTTTLGKSIIESNEKYDKLSRLSENPLIGNAFSLVGDYIPVNEYDNEQGYMRVGDYYIKPMTPQGQIVVNGIKTGNDLWNQYFPYSDENIKLVSQEILEITDASEKSDRKRIEMKFDIFKEMKKYINSHNKNGIFTDKASVERERLFIDTKTHKSLATYLNNIKISDLSSFEKGNKLGVYNLKSNKLFSKFEFNLNTNGEPSIVKYNNTSSENFDEDYLYTAIAEMVINQETLPDFNGKTYDSRKLASDLVTYAYLEGGVQEAIQFAKYIPIEYLETVGFTDILQNYSPKRDSSIFKRVLGIKELNDLNSHDTHRFVKQYIQHNPQMAVQYDKETENKQFKKKRFDSKTKILEAFQFESQELPKFITRKIKTKSKRKQDKFNLYQHLGNGQYQRISVLGVHGMNEYELGNENATSLLDKADPVVINNNKVSQNPVKQVNDRFGMKEGNITDIMTKVGNFKSGKYKHFGKLTEVFADFIKADVTVEVLDTEAQNGVKANGRTIVNPNGSIKIIIDSDLIASNNHEQIARTFVHEFIHSVTLQELGKYFDPSGKQKVKDLPLHISRLVRVFNEVKKVLAPELEALMEKRRKHLKGDLPSDTAYTAEELEVTYGATSIFEFVTTALTEPAFQKKMNEVQFKQSGQTIWEKFKQAIMNILFSNNITIKKDSVTYEALSSILEFIDTENNVKSNKNSTFGMSEQSDITPSDIKGIEDSDTDAINNAFDIPASILARLPELCD